MTETTKKCIRCGAVLPEEAAFCPCCTATQIHRRTIPLESPAARNQWWIGALAALVALALPVGAVLLNRAAQVETPPEDTTPLTAYHESEDGAEKRYSELFWPAGAGLHRYRAADAVCGGGGLRPERQRQLFRAAGGLERDRYGA